MNKLVYGALLSVLLLRTSGMAMAAHMARYHDGGCRCYEGRR